MQFDRKAPKAITIVSGGLRACVLRLLSDEQAVELARAQKTIRHSLPDGGSRTEVAEVEAEFLKVFNSCLVEPVEPAFDEFEAAAAIQRLTAVEVGEISRSGDLIIIPLKGDEFETQVFLRVPSQKQLTKFTRSATCSISKPRQRIVETTVNLYASGELFDSIFQSSTGYVESSVDQIPIGHKDAAVVSMLQYVDEQFNPASRNV
jgi:hypothetical protein